MPTALIVAPALIVATVLLVSGVAKLRTPDDESGWTEMGIPAALRQEWLMRVHPVAEILLGIALVVLGGTLGVVAGAAATVLFAVYLVMIWRAKQRSPDASCACFGARKPITGRTLLRNAWLVLLSALAAVGLGALPLFGGVLSTVEDAWPWMIALAAVAATFVLVGESDRAGVAPPAPATPPVTAPAFEGDPEEYIRVRTPAVPVKLADGTTENLRALASRGPILLLAVSETCGSCTPVIERAAAYRELLPEVSVRLLLTTAPERSALASRDEPQTLHDPFGYVSGSIDDWATPTAVLLGLDGMLAGGPVTGHPAIEEFVGDIYESLRGVRPPRDT